MDYTARNKLLTEQFKGDYFVVELIEEYAEFMEWRAKIDRVNEEMKGNLLERYVRFLLWND